MAAIAATTALPVLAFVRERPLDVGLTAYESVSNSEAAPPNATAPVDSASAGENSETPVSLDLSSEIASAKSSSRATVAAENELSATTPKGEFDSSDLVVQDQVDAAAVAVSTSMLPRSNSNADVPSAEPEPVPQKVSPFLLPFIVFREIAPKADFWFLAGSFFVCGASTNGLIATHLIPACVDSGMPEVQVCVCVLRSYNPIHASNAVPFYVCVQFFQAAGFLGGIGVFDIVGTIMSGALTDRIDSRVLLAAYYAFRGVALILLPWALARGLAGMWPFAVLYGLDWVATVPPTAALCSLCFGPKRSAIVFAWCLFFHQIGAASIAAIAGILRTELGSYEWAFWSSGLLCVLTAVAVLLIQRGVLPLRVMVVRVPR